MAMNKRNFHWYLVTLFLLSNAPMATPSPEVEKLVIDRSTWRAVSANQGSWSQPRLQAVDWQQEFERPAPLHVDIGTGKGKVLVEQPSGKDFNYIGIEKEGKYLYFGAARLHKYAIENARLLWGDGSHILKHCFEPQSVQRFSILFPDPWPKKRHLKRRIVNVSLLESLASRLKPNGDIWVVTDHAGYYEHILETFANSPQFTKVETLPPAGLTHFEAKYKEEGRPILRASYKLR